MKTPRILINVDVEDLVIGEAFYKNAFGMVPKRSFGGKAREMEYDGQFLYLLEKPAGSIAVGGASTIERHYDRHWTPVHLDIVVDNIHSALQRAEQAGAIKARGIAIQELDWGKIVEISDPFGNGLCLVEFVGRGYDEIATSN